MRCERFVVAQIASSSKFAQTDDAVPFFLPLCPQLVADVGSESFIVFFAFIFVVQLRIKLIDEFVVRFAKLVIEIDGSVLFCHRYVQGC